MNDNFRISVDEEAAASTVYSECIKFQDIKLESRSGSVQPCFQLPEIKV